MPAAQVQQNEIEMMATPNKRDEKEMDNQTGQLIREDSGSVIEDEKDE